VIIQPWFQFAIKFLQFTPVKPNSRFSSYSIASRAVMSWNARVAFFFAVLNDLKVISTLCAGKRPRRRVGVLWNYFNTLHCGDINVSLYFLCAAEPIIMEHKLYLWRLIWIYFKPKTQIKISCNAILQCSTRTYLLMD